MIRTGGSITFSTPLPWLRFQPKPPDGYGRRTLVKTRRLLWIPTGAGALLLVGIITTMKSRAVVQPFPPLTPEETQGRNRLKAHVQTLAGTIGGRDAVQYQGLRKAGDYIESQLQSSGYKPERQSFSVGGIKFDNLEAERTGADVPQQIVVVGAHYDTAGGLPGANDNGSGVAATLELARSFANEKLGKTIRWVLFDHEEL